MIDLHPIEVEAIALADSLNAEVVSRAIVHTPCLQCNYLKYKDSFQETLTNYIIWKIRFSRLQRRDWVYHDKEERRANYFGGYEHIHFELIHSNDRLSMMWPCQDCIAIHNPTGRTRRRYSGGRRNRKW